jgi:hypothetical protein
LHQILAFLAFAYEDKFAQYPSNIDWRAFKIEVLNMEIISPQIRHTLLDPTSARYFSFHIMIKTLHSPFIFLSFPTLILTKITYHPT